jgi:hypothetical protein
MIHDPEYGKARDSAEKSRLFWIITLIGSSAQQIAAHMREIGMSRILYGSDDDAGTPADSWRNTVAKLPLSEAEFNALAENEAPYLR